MIQHNGFEYIVTISLRVSMDDAELLKASAARHYDWKCKESGERGIINGLRNCALMQLEIVANGEPETGGNFMRCGVRDIDLMIKVLEGARFAGLPDCVERGYRLSKSFLELMRLLETERARLQGMPDALCMGLAGKVTIVDESVGPRL